MEMFKKMISQILRKRGYEISRINTLEKRIGDGEYKWLQEFGINTVLDVGANIGSFSIMINKIIPDATIYSFEPLNDCYQTLLSNTKEINRIKSFNLALGSQTGEALIHHNEFSPSSSLLDMNSLHKIAFPYTQKSVQEKVKISSLDEMAGMMECNKKVLLKIDVQGYELEVLKGAESSLNDVDLIIIETSFDELYQDQPLFDTIYKFLCLRDFRFEGSLDQFKDPGTGRILQGDAIFVKRIFVKT